MSPPAPADDSESVIIDDSYHDQLKSRFRLYKPAIVLAMFTLVNFFTYYDRGVMSAVLIDVKADTTICGDNNQTLSSSEQAALSSAFMAGYLVTSPLFATLGTKLLPKTIILIGLVAWMAAALCSGFAKGYVMLLLARCCVGIGEAAYVGYMITMVDNMAPHRLRTMWIGVFYSMIPVGNAVGIVAGGIIGDKANLSPTIGGWRVAFVTEVIPMVVLSVFMLGLPPEYNRKPRAGETVDESTERLKREKENADAIAAGTATSLNANPEADAAEEAARLLDDVNKPPSLLVAVKLLICNVDWLCLALGYGVYTFVLGGIVVWAITALTTGPLAMSKIEASVILGGVTAFTGLLGSLSGGIFLDRMGGSQGHHGLMRCSAFNVLMVIVSVPCGIIALYSSHIALFVPFFIVAVFVLFTITAPVNASILSSVQKNMRTYAINFSVLVMHGLGDFPSPIVAGKISDAFAGGCPEVKTEAYCGGANATLANCKWIPASGDDEAYCVNEFQWRNALCIVYAGLIFAAPLWGTVALRARCEVKKEEEMTTLAEPIAVENGGNSEKVK